jgi:hypothetical protein
MAGYDSRGEVYYYIDSQKSIFVANPELLAYNSSYSTTEKAPPAVLRTMG